VHGRMGIRLDPTATANVHEISLWVKKWAWELGRGLKGAKVGATKTLNSGRRVFHGHQGRGGKSHVKNIKGAFREARGSCLGGLMGPKEKRRDE